MLERVEHDANDKGGLTGKLMSLLFVSRNGLLQVTHHSSLLSPPLSLVSGALTYVARTSGFGAGASS